MIAIPNNLTFIYDNLIDQAHDLRCSSEVPTMPISWLRTQQRGEVWQSLNNDPVTIEFSTAMPVRPDYFGLIGDNLSALASIRLQLHTSNDFSGATLVDETITKGQGVYGAGDVGAGDDGYGGTTPMLYSAMLNRKLSAPFSYFFTAPSSPTPFGKITISDPFAADRCYRIGRLYVSKLLQLERAYNWGATVECIDPSKITGGQAYPTRADKRPPIFEWTINIGKLSSDSVFYDFLNLWLSVQTTDFFVVIFDPSTEISRRLSSHYVRFSQNPQLQKAYVNRNDLTLKFIEVL